MLQQHTLCDTPKLAMWMGEWVCERAGRQANDHAHAFNHRTHVLANIYVYQSCMQRERKITICTQTNTWIGLDWSKWKWVSLSSSFVDQNRRLCKLFSASFILVCYVFFSVRIIAGNCCFPLISLSLFRYENGKYDMNACMLLLLLQLFLAKNSTSFESRKSKIK